MALGEFRRRFALLSSDANARPGSPVADERRAVEDMLLTVDIDLALYRVGQSQVCWVFCFFISFSDERLIWYAKLNIFKTETTLSDIYKVSKGTWTGEDIKN